tara:strand:+ start:377 stop:556 length:180 start_codon:yes stop_codon:yes gene_type:complete
MEKFKVIPVNIRTGAKAPYFVVSLAANGNKQNETEARSVAKEMSSLSRYSNWDFEVNKI